MSDKIKKQSKNMQAIKSMLEDRGYSLQEAIKFLKDNRKEKFNSTVDIAMVTGLDTRHADQNLRVVAELPHGNGKAVRVAVITKNDAKQNEAKEAGADLVSADEIVEDIQKGQINFEVLIATPDMMAVLGKVAKILGPKGLMPNPKLGTVTMDVAKAVQSAKAGRVQLRADKGGVVHAGVGKINFTIEQLLENIKYVIDFANKSRPSGAKGKLIKSLFISTTMSPSLKIALDELN